MAVTPDSIEPVITLGIVFVVVVITLLILLSTVSEYRGKCCECNKSTCNLYNKENNKVCIDCLRGKNGKETKTSNVSV